MSDILHAPTKKILPTAEYVRSRLSYAPETGALYWMAPGLGRRAIKEAGGFSNGYLATRIDGTLYYNHRLAWLLTHGVWPVDKIDHVNGNRVDNRLVNLREATHSENLQNLRSARSDSRSGLMGAFFRRSGVYFSRIMTSGRLTHLGYFKTAEEANSAYLEAKRRLHPGCTI